ncbi:MAG TPA: response regulator transcription factor [Ktedonobacterales bacterium]
MTSAAEGGTTEPLTVLMADDHVLFRDGLRALLSAAPDLDLVGEATTGAEAITLAARLQPDVILMDLKMPGVSGIEATRQILRESPRIGVLMVTMFDEESAVFAAMRAGARGYILKGATHAEMLRAIRAVGAGEAIFSPPIARRLMEFFAQLRPVTTPSVFPELSDREREILDLLAQGYKNAEIASQLILSPHTVRNYVSNIISKLQVADRAHAILRARDAGMG